MKKILAIILAVCMMSSLMMLPAAAEAAPSVDFVGYTSARVEVKDLKNVPNIMKFDSVESDEYKITMPEGLLMLGALVKNNTDFTGITIYLANDLDMSEIKDFEPIGGTGETTYFNGTFDGQGNVIENLVVDYTGVGFGVTGTLNRVYIGLFAALGDATVKNLIIGENCSFTYGCLEVFPKKEPYLGAIAGCLVEGNGKGVTIDNCWNRATVSNDQWHSAGIVALVFGPHHEIKNTTNSGSITDYTCAAGFTTLVASSGRLTIQNSRNTGEIQMDNAAGDAWFTCAGFVARPTGKVTIKNSINNGVITGPNNLGAFYGTLMVSGQTLIKSTNYGTYSSKVNVGLIGQVVSSDGYYNPDALVVYTMSGCKDEAGETDESLALMENTIATDYTPNEEQDPIVGYSKHRVVKEDLNAVADILTFDEGQANAYKITSPEGLIKLGALVKRGNVDFTGITVYLANDLDMSGINDFEPIGGTGETAYFNGTFDGQGNTIDNLTVDYMGEGYSVSASLNRVYVGLFATLGDATVKNLIIGEHCSFTYGNVENAPEKEPYLGAIAGGLIEGTGKGVTIDNCWNRADVEDDQWYSAGIVALVMGENHIIQNTTNSGDITNNTCAAGFVTSVAQTGKLTIESCRNTGAVQMNNTAGNAWFTSAGFVARPGGLVTVKDCINNGNITGASNIGSFYGTIMVAGQSLINCINYGTYTANSNSGLIGEVVASDGYFNADNLVEYTVTNCVDKAGEPDFTWIIFAPETPNEDDDVNNDDPDNTEEETTGSEQVGTTELPVTEEPTDDKMTDNDTTAVIDDDKKGCSSVVIGSMALILMTAGAVIAFCKKKD